MIRVFKKDKDVMIHVTLCLLDRLANVFMQFLTTAAIAHKPISSGKNDFISVEIPVIKENIDILSEWEYRTAAVELMENILLVEKTKLAAFLSTMKSLLNLNWTYFFRFVANEIVYDDTKRWEEIGKMVDEIENRFGDPTTNISPTLMTSDYEVSPGKKLTSAFMVVREMETAGGSKTAVHTVNFLNQMTNGQYYDPSNRIDLIDNIASRAIHYFEPNGNWFWRSFFDGSIRIVDAAVNSKDPRLNSYKIELLEDVTGYKTLSATCKTINCKLEFTPYEEIMLIPGRVAIRNPY